MISGVVLIIMGLLFLGINFGYVNPEVWPSLWRFWPAILIIFGIVMLARKFMPKKVSVAMVIAILALATVGAVVVSSNVGSRQGDNRQEGNTESINIDEPLSSDIKKLNVELKLGAQELKIDSLSSGLVSGNINSVNGSPEYSLTTIGDEAKVSVSQKWSFSNLFNKNGKNKSQSQLDLSSQIPVSAKLSMGASKIDTDFSEILLSDLTLKTGAINGKLKIGSRQKIVDIKINTGASDITIFLPALSGLEVSNKSGITKIIYDKINMESANGDRTKSSDFETKDNKVYVDIKAGASSIAFVGY